jgi:hypothetical protein
MITRRRGWPRDAAGPGAFGNARRGMIADQRGVPSRPDNPGA